MVRESIAGATDYTFQSLEEIAEDLRGWIRSLNNTIEKINGNIKILEANDYWQKKVFPGFRMDTGYLKNYFNLVIKTFTIILNDWETEVTKGHIKQIASLGEKADDYNRTTCARLYPSEYSEWFSKERERFNNGASCEDKELMYVEHIFNDMGDAIANMLDLMNIPSRLEDFIGNSSKAKQVSISSSFPTPPGTKWEQLTIIFIDGHNVKIKCNGLKKKLDYITMGFKDNKSGKPNEQWGLLQKFAEHGSIYWNNSKPITDKEAQLLEIKTVDEFSDNKSSRCTIEKVHNVVKKRKQLLSATLKKCFNIKGDPFEDYRKHKAYKPKFSIKYE